MALYEYKCGDCGTEFELLESMHRNGSKRCRVCGGIAERVISASSLRFMGSGFHCTDYGRYGKRKQNLI